jgi:tetratricopeptide (TPR) repeat protein
MSGAAAELRTAGNRALAARQYETASRAFSALIEIEPASPDGYVGMARVLERTGRTQEIVELLESVAGQLEVAGVVKALADAYRVLANRGDRQAVARAIRWYEAYLRQREDAVALYYLGELHREHRKDYQTALELFWRSWNADPGSRSVYQAALDCATRLGRKDEVERLTEAWRNKGRE